jgi:hypothetical protein
MKCADCTNERICMMSADGDDSADGCDKYVPVERPKSRDGDSYDDYGWPTISRH